MEWNGKVKLLKVPNHILGDGHTFIFNTEKEKIDYLTKYAVQELTYEKTSYIRTNGGSMILPINDDKLSAIAPNMIIFQNTNFGDRWYVADIINHDYTSINTSTVNYAVDSWLTYMDKVDFSKKTRVARRTWRYENGANEIINLPMEDLDIGNEYLVTDLQVDDNGTAEDYRTGQFYYFIMTKDLLNDKSSKHAIITGEVELVDTNGGILKYNGGTTSPLYGYIMNFQCMEELFTKGVFISDCEFVNALQLIVKLPYGRELFPQTLVNVKDRIPKGTELSKECECYEHNNWGRLFKNKKINGLFTNIKKYINEITGQGGTDVPHTAIGQYLLRYPYSLLEITDFYNQPDTLKLDNISKNTVQNEEYTFMKDTEGLTINKYGSIGQTPALIYSVGNYLNSSINKQYNDSTLKGGEGALMGTNFYTILASTTISIISDYLATFMQSESNKIDAQRVNLRETLSTQVSNAGASLQAAALSSAIAKRNAMMVAQNDYNNAVLTADQTAQTALMNAKRTFDAGQTEVLYNMAAGAIGAAGQTGMGVMTHNVGDVGRGVMSALGVVGTSAVEGIKNSVSMQNATNTALMNQTVSKMTASNTMATMAEVARNNALAAQAQASAQYGNAMRLANTEYNNASRMLTARIQDAKNIPPSVQNMGSCSSLFNILNNRDSIVFKTKTLPKEVLQRLADYFVENGFLTNKLENLETVINSFNDKPGFFIQTINANIGGDVPPEHLINIRQMLDGGVFLWKADNFKNYDAIYNY